MSEDSRTLWVGNLHEDVTDELVYELFLQTGPIDRLVFPTEGTGEEKKHKGHAYVLFKHAESVQFASQVLEGTKLFDNVLEMKARSMPVTYRTTPMSQSANNNPRGRYDNNSLRGGFNRTNTWHGREDFVPRGRGGGGYRHKGPSNFNQNQNNNYNQGGYNNYNNQMNQGYWSGQQQTTQQQVGGNNSSVPAYSTDMDAKRQRLLQQQNLVIQGTQNQQQQGMMNMNPQMYTMQQQTWNTTGYNNSYSTTNTTTNYSTDVNAWNSMNTTGNASNMYQAYGDQYNNWYTQQQQQ